MKTGPAMDTDVFRPGCVIEEVSTENGKPFFRIRTPQGDVETWMRRGYGFYERVGGK